MGLPYHVVPLTGLHPGNMQYSAVADIRSLATAQLLQALSPSVLVNFNFRILDHLSSLRHISTQRPDSQVLKTMPYILLVFAHRKPGLSPVEFKSHYESRHLPLIQTLTGSLFPKSHTRRYIQRVQGPIDGDADNANHPAVVMVGTPADFEYDAFAEIVFDDEAAFQAFFACITQAEAARRIAEDEELFLDREKMRVVVVDDCTVTTGLTTDR